MKYTWDKTAEGATIDSTVSARIMNMNKKEDIKGKERKEKGNDRRVL